MQIVKKVYDWVLAWADTPYAPYALFLLAFTESSFFPIPPDVLLITMAISLPLKAFRFALICSVGSVLGGIFGYGIGVFFMDSVGMGIIEWYGVTAKYEQIEKLYQDYDAVAVFLAGFTPIPYKVFTIAAGAFNLNFAVFVLASLISRSARFFILAFLIHKYGAGIKIFIEKYFNILTIVFTVIIIGGFVLVRYLF